MNFLPITLSLFSGMLLLADAASRQSASCTTYIEIAIGITAILVALYIAYWHKYVMALLKKMKTRKTRFSNDMPIIEDYKPKKRSRR
jgi:hypothetical protein